ncbi:MULTISPECIES: hypothetical protein [Clostridium]|uniref:hypothetical protein n=1 Tax=Clostridium TaxID=1485 RepID=UPI002902B032|nr:hypothetical protein [Clostridium sp.]MDU1587028.1 hypothetical protein [Clostridium sp.]
MNNKKGKIFSEYSKLTIKIFLCTVLIISILFGVALYIALPVEATVTKYTKEKTLVLCDSKGKEYVYYNFPLELNEGFKVHKSRTSNVISIYSDFFEGGFSEVRRPSYTNIKDLVGRTVLIPNLIDDKISDYFDSKIISDESYSISNDTYGKVTSVDYDFINILDKNGNEEKVLISSIDKLVYSTE